MLIVADDVLLKSAKLSSERLAIQPIDQPRDPRGARTADPDAGAPVDPIASRRVR
jgi:hypothetical protein